MPGGSKKSRGAFGTAKTPFTMKGFSYPGSTPIKLAEPVVTPSKDLMQNIGSVGMWGTNTGVGNSMWGVPTNILDHLKNIKKNRNEPSTRLSRGGYKLASSDIRSAASSDPGIRRLDPESRYVSSAGSFMTV